MISTDGNSDTMKKSKKANSDGKTQTKEQKNEPIVSPKEGNKITTNLLKEYLGDWFFSSAVKNLVAAAFTKGVPYQITPFLNPTMADKIYQEILSLSDRMKLMEGYMDYFQYHHHNLYQHTDTSFQQSKHLQQLHEILNSHTMREWMIDCLMPGSNSSTRVVLDGQTLSSISEYRGHDYSMVHHDSALGPFGNMRKIAFVLHMAKNWDSKFGGDFVYLNPVDLITARYNNMILFRVSNSSFHIVTPVVPNAPTHMRRFAYSGWWHGP
jgi:Rps23 Pro-64 3,4-dihydroxylase Tpa1-like proline 4-hydroxylase